MQAKKRKKEKRRSRLNQPVSFIYPQYGSRAALYNSDKSTTERLDSTVVNKRKK